MSNQLFDTNNPSSPWYMPPPAEPASPSLAELLANMQLPPPPATYGLGSLADLLPKTTVRPRVFVSYQHSSDQYYYDEFSRIFHDNYETVYDASLERRIDSENSDYVMQRIRDGYLTGTSCTILLVGPTAYQRKFIDWEIKATLDKEHGLIGIQLPNVAPRLDGKVTVPDRFAQNVRSGYALWEGFSWQSLLANPSSLNHLIQSAANRQKWRIVNPREILKRNM